MISGFALSLLMALAQFGQSNTGELRLVLP
jgi:hypothetical protein